MKRAEIIRSLSLREQADAFGWIPLLSVLAGLLSTVGFYATGDVLRAIFWLLVMALGAFWAIAGLETAVRDFKESETRVPFSGRVINKQEETVLNAWAKAKQLSDALGEYGGQTLDYEQYREVEQLARRVKEAEQDANCEVLHLARMIQTNARVATGAELISDAQRRVYESYLGDKRADLDALLAARKKDGAQQVNRDDERPGSDIRLPSGVRWVADSEPLD